MLIDKDFFSQDPKLKIVKVKLTDKKEVFIRELTAGEFFDIEREAYKGIDTPDKVFDQNKYQIGLVSRSMCDSKGEPILSKDTYKRAGEVLNKPDLVLLYIKCREVNRLDEDLEALAGK